MLSVALRYLLSQYVWIIAILLVCSPGFIIFPYIDPGVIQSNHSWNPQSDPIILAHITDTHVNINDSTFETQFRQAADHSYQYGFDKIIMTGDAVDDWTKFFDHKIASQVEQDFIHYASVISLMKSRNQTVIDIAGNHDEFAVPSFSSKRHFAREYIDYLVALNASTPESFWISSVIVGDFEIFVLNLYEYPTVRSLLAFFVYPSIYLLDVIEQGLSVPRRAKYRIVVSHFSLVHVYNMTRSSSGKTFTEIVVDSGADYILTGHAHPLVPTFQHHNGILEVVGPDVKDHQRYSILTFDRDQMSYHDIGIDERLVAMMTYPIPKAQLSRRSTFDLTSAEIRVIAFSERPDLSISVSGAVTGKLAFQRILRTNLSLYTLPFNLSYGEYVLNFTGDWNSSATFVIGDSVTLDPEYVVNPWYWFLTLDVIAVLLWIGLFVATAPFLSTELGEEINAWIGGEGDDSFALTAIICGVLGIRARLAKLSSWIQYMLFAFVLCPFLIPSGVSLIGDHIYTVFWGGYFVGLRYSYDPYPQVFTTVYIAAAVLPYVCYMSHAAIARNAGFIFDTLVVLAGAIGNLVFVSLCPGVALGTVSVLLSPMFTIIPMFLFFMNITASCRKRVMQKGTESRYLLL
jgi:hypothetical protein